MSMIVQVFGPRPFHEHYSESIWSETLDLFILIVQVFGERLFHEHDSASIWSETLS